MPSQFVNYSFRLTVSDGFNPPVVRNVTVRGVLLPGSPEAQAAVVAAAVRNADQHDDEMPCAHVRPMPVAASGTLIRPR